jgi:hypothetical protein
MGGAKLAWAKLTVAVHESAPVQGFGCRPARAVRDAPAADVRKPPRNEPAEVMLGGGRALRYGDLAEAEGASGSAQTSSR